MGFCTVRLYSTDCSALGNVGSAAARLNLSLILGIFISHSGISSAYQQVDDIITWGQWPLVDLIVIGNEAIFSGYTTAPALAAFIYASKSDFRSAGYTGMTTTTEPLNVLEEYASDLCWALDIVGVNIHPFFNAEVTASSAGAFVAAEMIIVEGLCEGLSGINLETGWPSIGECNGEACPGEWEQKIAIEGIVSAAGGRSVLFSFVNDYWKDSGVFGCEQSWGVSQLFS